MNIHTYFDEVPGFNVENQLRLIDLWNESWSKRGWGPTMVNLATAKKHPRFGALQEAVAKLPTVNGHGYEDTCYYRWPALAVCGGGWLSDYDVMNYGFLPEPPPEIFTTLSEVVYWKVPCVAGGTVEAINRFIEAIIAYKPDDQDALVAAGPPNSPDWRFYWGEPREGVRRPHCSDQVIATRLAASRPDVIRSRFICHECYRGPWETAPLVHFPTGVMTPKGLEPKWKHIKGIRAFA